MDNPQENHLDINKEIQISMLFLCSTWKDGFCMPEWMLLVLKPGIHESLRSTD